MGTSYQFFSYSLSQLEFLFTEPADEQIEDIADAYMDCFDPKEEIEDDEEYYTNLILKIKSYLKKENIKEIYRLKDDEFLNEIMVALLDSEDIIESEIEYINDCPGYKYVNNFFTEIKDEYKLNHSLIFLDSVPDDVVVLTPEKAKLIYEELKPVCELDSIKEKYEFIYEEVYMCIKNTADKEKGLAYIIG